MKKLFPALLVTFALLAAKSVWATSDNVSPPESDIVTWQHAGATNTAVAISSEGRLNVPSGLMTVHEHFETLPAISTIAYLDVRITTTILRAQNTAYTSATGEIVHPKYPNALTFSIRYASIPVYTDIISTVQVNGVDAQGRTITEIVPGLRMNNVLVSSNAFAKISSVTFSKLNSLAVTSETATMCLTIGSTGTYGLAGNLNNTDDFYKAISWGINATSITVRTDFNTWSFPANVTGVATTDIWYRNSASAPPKPR